MSHWREHGGTLTTTSGQRVTLTPDEVMYILNRDADLNADSVQVDYHALAAERYWHGMASANPDGKSLVLEAPSSVSGMQVRMGHEDKSVRRQVAHAVDPRAITTVDGGRKWLSTVTVTLPTGEQWSNVYGLGMVWADSAQAREAASKRKRAGRRPSCECTTCTKCRARARKQASRAKQAGQDAEYNAIIREHYGNGKRELTGHALGLPSVHVDA